VHRSPMSAAIALQRNNELFCERLETERFEGGVDHRTIRGTGPLEAKEAQDHKTIGP